MSSLSVFHVLLGLLSILAHMSVPEVAQPCDMCSKIRPHVHVLFPEVRDLVQRHSWESPLPKDLQTLFSCVPRGAGLNSGCLFHQQTHVPVDAAAWSVSPPQLWLVLQHVPGLVLLCASGCYGPRTPLELPPTLALFHEQILWSYPGRPSNSPFWSTLFQHPWLLAGAVAWS